MCHDVRVILVIQYSLGSNVTNEEIVGGKEIGAGMALFSKVAWLLALVKISRALEVCFLGVDCIFFVILF